MLCRGYLLQYFLHHLLSVIRVVVEVYDVRFEFFLSPIIALRVSLFSVKIVTVVVRRTGSPNDEELLLPLL